MTIKTGSMLDEDVHRGIIADMPHILSTANIPEKYIHASMLNGECGPAEIDFIKHFKRYRAEGLGGLAIVGVDTAPTRMMEMCGALLRNFIDARIVTTIQLLDAFKAGNVPEPSVMMIPNFFVNPIGKWGLHAFEIQKLHDLLLSRLTANKPTVIYVEDMDVLKQTYGTAFASFIKGQYKITED